MALVLPLVLKSLETPSRSGHSKSDGLISSSFRRASLTSLATWEHQKDSFDDVSGTSTPVGLAVGTEDGSLYLFHPGPQDSVPKSSRRQSATLSASGKPRFVRTSSGSSSPSIHSHHAAPFQMTTRTGAVSVSVSKEQVEAPKNYVDFDDEPEKLKDILRGKDPARGEKSDKTAYDQLLTAVDKISSRSRPTSPSRPSTPNSARGRDGATRGEDTKAVLSSSRLSAKRPGSPKSPPSPTSPGPLPNHSNSRYRSLQPFVHCRPCCFVPGRSIADLVDFDGKYVVALQETG